MIDLSRIKGRNVQDIAAAVPDILKYFETEIELANNRISIRGKTAADAYKEQADWALHYGLLKAECSKFAKHLANITASERGHLVRSYVEQYTRELGERTREKYIDAEPSYVALHALQLEAEEVLAKLIAICDACDRRGFALRDWTQLTIESMQHTII